MKTDLSERNYYRNKVRTDLSDRNYYRNTMLGRKFILIFICILFFQCFLQEATLAQAGEKSIDFYLFYSITCGSCTKARQFIRELKPGYPQITFHELEIVKNRKNQELFMELNEELRISVPGVPIFILGDEYIVGFRDDARHKRRIIALIGRHLQIDKSWKWSDRGGRPLIRKFVTKQDAGDNLQEERSIFIPAVGEIDPRGISLPLFTVFIGLLDGVNPCALWVLMFLLTLLVNSKNRTRLIVVGMAFVGTSAAVYLIFMAAWLSIFTLIGMKRAVTVGLGIIAILIGVINMKELFFFKRGVSLMIPEGAKPALFKRMRNIMDNPNLFLSIAGVISLAIFVNFIEFGCTVGLPAIYTRVLSYQQINTVTKYLYMVLYNVCYVIPLIAVVLLFIFTMGKYRLQEKHGKVLKVVSGALLFFLGIILIFNPGLLMFS